MHHRTLFDEVSSGVTGHDFLGVPGLLYRPGLLNDEEGRAVLAAIDQQPWQHALKRRVQHYGYKYDYKSRAVDRSMFVGPLPSFALGVASRLLDLCLIGEMPDQLIVNEYMP